MNARKPILIPDHLFGIIGHPLGHTLSPLIHNWGFQEYGMPAVYCRWPVPSGGLPEFLAAVRRLPIAGVSVTIPHKRGIMPYLDGLTTDALQTGAVNTLVWRNDALWGENTDVQGFLAPLLAQPKRIQSALILGVGGASRAAVWGLKRIGVEKVMVCGRNKEATHSLAVAAECGKLSWEERDQWSGDLLVNATPLGMFGKFQSESPWPCAMSKIRIVYDLVYNPQETCFIQQARTSGVQVITGLEMFIAQAQGQFRLWTKKELPGESVRELLMSALGGVR